TLIRLSTSSVESPGASVWTSIKGGANSGKTSRGAFRARWIPTIMSTIERASTMTRSRSELETIQFIMSGQNLSSSSFQPTEFSAIKLSRPLRDDFGTDLGTVKERREISDNAIDEDTLPGVGVGRNIDINPATPVSVADQARSRYDQTSLGTLERKRD